jgi:excisionase family DNA binding protein
MTDSPWTTVKAAARTLSVSRMTIYRLVERGDLHGIRVGRQVRVCRKCLDALQGKGEGHA